MAKIQRAAKIEIVPEQGFFMHYQSPSTIFTMTLPRVRVTREAKLPVKPVRVLRAERPATDLEQARNLP